MKQYKIWYLSTEVSPFAKTGGLGDVCSSFPKALKTKDYEIRATMPKYKIINERKYILREVIRLKEIPVTINGVTKIVSAKSAFLPDSKVQIYFVDIPEYFGRIGLYSDKQTGKDYEDNAQRFAYFCKGTIEILKILSWKPDIIHCNDWQTAFVPIYLKTLYKDDEFYQGIKTVFTIHNLAFQGSFDIETAKSIDIDPSLIENDGPAGKSGYLNLVKGAINYSDWVTTVSEKYADEISTSPDYGYGLEDFINKNKSKFTGILNGVDYSVWAPAKDKYIPFKYSKENLQGKEQNKQALLTRVNMPFTENTPLIGIIARIVDQKGFDLLVEALDSLLELELQIIILGTGDKNLENEIETYQKKYPNKISLNKAFDETLAHMIEAGSDFFLMPSKFEPCGMNQIYSLKYGTLPIVFKTGGLADTISELDEKEKTGNGFTFDKYTSKEMIRVIKKALKFFKNKGLWSETQDRIMQEDFSWDNSIDKYSDVYENVAGE
jgi:starch synthase